VKASLISDCQFGESAIDVAVLVESKVPNSRPPDVAPRRFSRHPDGGSNAGHCSRQATGQQRSTSVKRRYRP
jgi:hypothetical protein